MKSRLLFAVVSLVGFFTAECAFSADVPAHKAKVLFLTQSKGYLHSSVNRTPEKRATGTPLPKSDRDRDPVPRQAEPFGG